jgi:hypothetical protein
VAPSQCAINVRSKSTDIHDSKKKVHHMRITIQTRGSGRNGERGAKNRKEAAELDTSEIGTISDANATQRALLKRDGKTETDEG